MQISEIATKADIEEILKAIQNLQSTLSSAHIDQKFLRSADVRKLLNISDGTLQRLRVSGTLKAKKVNGTWFYKLSDIEKLMQDGKN
ncbi:MAG: helix-turn-helix domain-containing protein [Chitinophagaceae bacterium]